MPGIVVRVVKASNHKRVVFARNQAGKNLIVTGALDINNLSVAENVADMMIGLSGFRGASLFLVNIGEEQGDTYLFTKQLTD